MPGVSGSRRTSKKSGGKAYAAVIAFALAFITFFESFAPALAHS